MEDASGSSHNYLIQYTSGRLEMMVILGWLRLMSLAIMFRFMLLCVNIEPLQFFRFAEMQSRINNGIKYKTTPNMGL